MNFQEFITCTFWPTLARHLDLEKLSPEYNLRRWCVDAKNYSSFNDETDRIRNSKESLINQIFTLRHLWNMIIDQVISENSYELAKKGMDEIVDEMKQIILANGDTGSQRHNGNKVM